MPLQSTTSACNLVKPTPLARFPEFCENGTSRLHSRTLVKVLVKPRLNQAPDRASEKPPKPWPMKGSCGSPGVEADSDNHGSPTQIQIDTTNRRSNNPSPPVCPYGHPFSYQLQALSWGFSAIPEVKEGFCSVARFLALVRALQGLLCSTGPSFSAPHLSSLDSERGTARCSCSCAWELFLHNPCLIS